MSNTWCVYKHTTPNGKCYIGITSRIPTERWRSGEGYKKNQHFYNAILKYGWDSISHEILYSGLSEKTAKTIEAVLTFTLRTTKPEFGYNNCLGGGRGCTGAHWIQTDEHRRKISEALKGRTGELSANYGKTFSEEHKRRISESKRGKPSSRKGGHLSESHKCNISKSLVGKPREYARKKVCCVTLDREFESITVAGNELSIDTSSIVAYCKGKRKTAGGYSWRYV